MPRRAIFNGRQDEIPSRQSQGSGIGWNDVIYDINLACQGLSTFLKDSCGAPYGVRIGALLNPVRPSRARSARAGAIDYRGIMIRLTVSDCFVGIFGKEGFTLFLSNKQLWILSWPSLSSSVLHPLRLGIVGRSSRSASGLLAGQAEPPCRRPRAARIFLQVPAASRRSVLWGAGMLLASTLFSGEEWAARGPACYGRAKPVRFPIAVIFFRRLSGLTVRRDSMSREGVVGCSGTGTVPLRLYGVRGGMEFGGRP
jgi:hypothetical protein